MLFKLPTALKKIKSKPTPSGLLLPQLLERVFDFIDDDTIHDTIILVTRNDSSKTSGARRLDKFISRLPSATRLKWTTRYSDLVSPDDQKILQALERINNSKDQSSIADNGGLRAADLTGSYLRESPNLLHLKASQSFCLIERMDLFGRWMPLPRYGEDAYRQPGIRMCRQLQTPHIEVHNLGSADRQLSPTCSHFLFGYFSRLCPNLRDIETWEPENIPGLFLELPGGLCLLVRFRLLETLHIGSGKNPQTLMTRDDK
ncbi:hypothetical protein KI688_003699 [Linnemannia hyalina]|uniref:Uncharacterized protein n=1 Tax=Linnemannia hyalina TaxID=64524 RepID=A0A9P8BQ36_9FUNG|nr:hypothetical protein KI688_003699 [Linnemannia hyalina]